MKIVVENIFTCLVLFWKYYFPINFSHGNLTHGSKLRQSKATTTKIPPPHNHNNNKNQNHREREIGGSKIGRSKARSRGGEIEGAIGVVWSSDWSSWDRAARCDRCGAAIGKTGMTSACDRRTGLELGVRLFFLSLSLSLSVRNSFEVKIGTKTHFRGQSVFFSVNWNWFLENSIFRTNQTPAFSEKHFQKWFSPKTNTPLKVKNLI